MEVSPRSGAFLPPDLPSVWRCAEPVRDPSYDGGRLLLQEEMTAAVDEVGPVLAGDHRGAGAAGVFGAHAPVVDAVQVEQGVVIGPVAGSGADAAARPGENMAR